MKKRLLLLLLGLLLPLAARAVTLPYAPDTVLSVLEMTDVQRTLADFLYTPVFNMDGHIDLPKGTAYDDVSAAMNCLMQDYPELFHLGKDYVIGYYRDTPEFAAWVEPQYRMSAEEAAAARAVLYAQAYLIADACPDALALHDRLCSMVTYGGDTDLRHTAAGALLEGRATCEGYAQAMTLLFRLKGVPCGVITGMAEDSAGVSERHSWCIADIGGYTLIDPTWNDQDALGLNTHWYYGLSSGEMSADHSLDAGQRIPLCGTHANWHGMHGYILSSAEDADAAILRLVQGETVNLRIPDEALYRALTEDAHAFLDGYNQRHPQDAFYGAYSLTECDAQQCIILRRAE